MKIPKTQSLRTLFSLVISLSILLLLFFRIDARKVMEALSACNLSLLLLSAAISLSVNIFLGAHKWRKILGGLGYSLSFQEALAIRSGFLPFKILFPLKSSEIVKVFYLEQQKGVGRMRGLSSLIFDKTLNLGVTLGIFLAALVWVGKIFSPFLPAGALCILGGVLFSTKARRGLLKIAGRFHPRLANLAKQLLSGFEEIALKEKTLLIFYSLIYQLSEFVNTYILFKAVGVTVPFSMVLIFVPLVMIVNNFPVTVLGLGTREALLVFLFSSYGPAASLLSAGLLISLIEHVGPVAFGFFFMKPCTAYLLSLANGKFFAGGEGR